MTKSKVFLPILVPSATVFMSSACIMILELVASRLIARHLGSSLYTWTSVIGVVLAGITIGNYLGGRIADKFAPKKSLASLFGLASVACVIVVIGNNIVGEWIWLMKFNWPVRVFCHISLVFLLPSVILGTISPVVAKMALDKGLATGRTVGDIYAWGAAGSIVGTFLAGFYLIAALGTIHIIWIVSGLLLLIGILYRPKFWGLYVWAALYTASLVMGMAPGACAETAGHSLGLREKPNPQIIYEDETNYCYIAVNRLSENPDRRLFMQDKLKHSEVLMDNPSDLQYFYSKVYSAVTEEFCNNKENPSFMVIGGGGYVYPRYLKKLWPKSRVDVVEIDPDVTEAAMAAFGLSRYTTINTISMDARNYVDGLLERKGGNEDVPLYDFIYEDAFNDYSVPFQLVTDEFNKQLDRILTDDGIYMINLVDIFDSGLFLGSVVNTLRQTFPYVYVTTQSYMPRLARSTFVVIGSKIELDLREIISKYKKEELELWYLDDSDFDELERKSHGLILTDDYAPVDNLLAPVVRDSAEGFLGYKYLELAKDCKESGQFEKSIKYYQSVIKTTDENTVKAYNEIGSLYAKMGDLPKSIKAFESAIEFKNQGGFDMDGDIVSIYFNLGVALKQSNKPAQSQKQFQKVIELRRLEIADKPSYKRYASLGNAYYNIGDFKSASEAFTEALKLNPTNIWCYDRLIEMLEYQNRYDDAIKIVQKQIQRMEHSGQQDAVAELHKQLNYLKYKKAEKNEKTNQL